MVYFLGENGPFSQKPYIFSIFAPMNDVLMIVASAFVVFICGFLMGWVVRSALAAGRDADTRH